MENIEKDIKNRIAEHNFVKISDNKKVNFEIFKCVNCNKMYRKNRNHFIAPIFMSDFNWICK